MLPTTGEIAIKPEWVDFNGHLNMAYYMVIFDKALDDLLTPIGLSAEYVTRENKSAFATEVHLNYIKEVMPQDKVYVNFRILDLTTKAYHYGCELFRAKDNALCATMDGITLHMDMVARKTAPFPEDMYKRLQEWHKAHQQLPENPLFGKSCKIKYK
jgi:acyl-CoA thioester hydrolase